MNVVDELLSSKEEALAATLASVILVHCSPISVQGSLHVAVIENYSATLELVPDRAGRAVDFSSDSAVGAAIVVQLLNRDPVLERKMPTLFVHVHDRI